MPARTVGGNCSLFIDSQPITRWNQKIIRVSEKNREREREREKAEDLDALELHGA